MNRCLYPLVSIALLCGFVFTAQAQQQAPTESVRHFPAKAQRGAFVVTTAPNVEIDGKPERLSPGARIWGANRMLVLSASIVGQNLLVNYVREPQGLVHEVWILNEAEAKQTLPKAP